eukprot:TRINITY_DN4487_c0_g1_i1.p1 TRINITY_DN4487_c0_g1~~TRINITY_DN4487_c0_g1_i1.p1  ORF type:complete len:497 (+),score=100.08 TRINITY_DN4487_c0_g1_i1:2-1492(+)
MNTTTVTAADLEALRAEFQLELAHVKADTDTIWVLVTAILVFSMQIGFAMLSAGSVRSKNVKNILLKNVLDACVGALGWYVIGFAFAFGPDGNKFIGSQYYALSDHFAAPGESTYAFFFFQYTFAATAATIVSGAVAERTQFVCYLIYSFFLTSFVYPVVAHWVWSPHGWLSAVNYHNNLFGVGLLDFSGCGVVHMVGGLAGLCGAYIVGPRKGRFDFDGKPVPMPGHSAALQVLGTFLLWFGWYGFNPGSTLAINGYAKISARAAVTTTLAPGAAAVASLFLQRVLVGDYDLAIVLNGLLSGLVGITASCSYVQPWAAVAIGATSAVVYIFASRLVLRLRIDDPLDAAALHYGCGMWGLICGAFFGDQDLIADVYGVGPQDHRGIFYADDGTMLGAHLVAILAITAWVAGLMLPFFWIMNRMGWMRTPLEIEEAGIDASKHGGAAYPEVYEGAPRIKRPTGSFYVPQKDEHDQKDTDTVDQFGQRVTFSPQSTAV